MNILYIFSGLSFGGATHSLLTIIEGAQRCGHKCFAIVPLGNDNMLVKYLERINVKTYSMPISFSAYPNVSIFHAFGLSWLKYFFNYLKNQRVCIKQIKSIIYTQKINIVHTNVGPVRTGYIAAKKMKIPHVWHIREYGDIDFHIREFPTKKYFQFLLRSSYVVCITNDILKYNNLDDVDNAMVIYNGVRSIKETNIDLHKDKFFLSASRISEEKCIDQMIYAFSLFSKKHSDYSLVILGEGPQKYVNKLKDLAQKLGVSHKVVFEGYTNEVTKYMQKARALLVCSRSEGFGRMTAEAAFAGCLVIGRNSAGTKEIMDIVGGYRFETTEQLVRSMECIANMEMPQYFSEISKTQDLAVSNFSKESYVQQILGLYLKINKND